MLLSIAIFLGVAVLVLGIAVWAIYDKGKTKREEIELKNDVLKKSADAAIEAAKKSLALAQGVAPKRTQIKTFNLSDGGFLATIADITSKPQVIFLFDTIKRRLMDSIIMEPDPNKIHNLAMKLKGVHVVELAFINPAGLDNSEEE